MKDVLIDCEDCQGTYVGTHYDTKEKKGKHGKYLVVTYQSHCTNCDKPIFVEFEKSAK